MPIMCFSEYQEIILGTYISIEMNLNRIFIFYFDQLVNLISR